MNMVDSIADDIIRGLNNLSDDDLEKVEKAAIELMAERRAQKKKGAEEEIKRIAQEHGIVVTLGGPSKRGRPRKKA